MCGYIQIGCLYLGSNKNFTDLGLKTLRKMNVKLQKKSLRRQIWGKRPQRVFLDGTLASLQSLNSARMLCSLPSFATSQHQQ